MKFQNKEVYPGSNPSRNQRAWVGQNGASRPQIMHKTRVHQCPCLNSHAWLWRGGKARLSRHHSLGMDGKPGPQAWTHTWRSIPPGGPPHKDTGTGWNCHHRIMAHLTYQASIWPLERRDGLLQRQRKRKLRDNALGRWGANPEVVVFAFNWRPPHGWLQYTWAEEPRRGSRSAPPPHHSPWPTRGLPWPSNAGLCRAGEAGTCQRTQEVLAALRTLWASYVWGCGWERRTLPSGQEELAMTGGRPEGCPVGARRWPLPAISFPTVTVRGQVWWPELEKCMSVRDTELLGAGNTC